MIEIGYALLGLVAGIFSGLLGIGGGTIVVPALVYIFGMTQHKAQGTILAAFLPPVALLAFFQYYRSGDVNLKAACLIACGIFLGGYLGALLGLSLSEMLARRIFGVFLLIIAIQMILNR